MIKVLNLSIIIIIIFINSLNGQALVKFKYFDKCKGSVVNLDYEMTLMGKDSNPIAVKDSIILTEAGQYLCTVYLQKGDFTASYDFNKIIENNKTYTDTIELPRLFWWFNNALHSQEWEYHFCDKICNGHEVEYHKNGQKWIEGHFINGKPLGKIKFYDRKGLLVKIEKYDKKGLVHIIYKNSSRYLINN